jgi:hypothetical protein
MDDTRSPGRPSALDDKSAEECANELIRYETVTLPGLRTYWGIHFAPGSEAAMTAVRELMKAPLGRLGRVALALIGKFPAEVSEPSVRLSPHSAPIRQTCRSYRAASARTDLPFPEPTFALHRLKQIMETRKVTDTSYSVRGRFFEHLK